jgi:hypothetical protein
LWPKRKDEKVTIMARSTTAFIEKDLVAEAIGKALRTAQAAQKAAYEDVRTSSGICTDYLDDAVKSLQDAAHWFTDLRKEEKADERRSTQPQAKPEPKVQECHICGNEIEPDDLAICSGCETPRARIVWAMMGSARNVTLKIRHNLQWFGQPRYRFGARPGTCARSSGSLAGSYCRGSASSYSNV